MGKNGHFHDMWAGGSGLPVAAIGWSIVISFAGCWAWLESAQFWAWISAGGFWASHDVALSDSFIAFFIAAAFALLAQWTANFCTLRLRGGASRWLWLGYGICAIYAAVSLHHVHEAMAAPGWQARVEARAEARAADEAIVRDNRAFLQRVQERTLAQSTDVVTSRIEAVSGPILVEAERAERAIAAAEQRLETIPALPAERPKDWSDLIVAALALGLAVLEFVLYWGMVVRPKSATDVDETSRNEGAGIGTSAGEMGTGTVVDLSVEAGKRSKAVQIVEEPAAKPVGPVHVGNLTFDLKAGGRALIDELVKAGVLNEFDLRSKVNSITAFRRHHKAQSDAA